MIILGIDPGLNGAFAVLNGTELTVSPMPVDAGGVCARGTWDLFMSYKGLAVTLGVPFFVAIEKSQVMPKQGSVSGFTYGLGNGILIGQTIAVRPTGWVLVKPKQWQKDCWEGTDSELDPKQRSLQAVMRLFPDVEIQKRGPRSKKFHDGIVDAMLIAFWARKYFV